MKVVDESVRKFLSRCCVGLGLNRLNLADDDSERTFIFIRP